MNETSSPQPKPRRRWLQFSLRTLLLLMVPVACVAAWLGAEYQKGRRQNAAIAWVEEMDGFIEYDDEATQNDWRRQVFGEWFPAKGVRVGILTPQVTDLAPLAELENIEALVIMYTEVNDLAPLAELDNLRELRLSMNPQVADLTPLAKLENLVTLDLAGHQVSDLAPLSSLKNLDRLDLNCPQVSDIAPLADLENLRWLSLNFTQVTDVAPLAELKNLETLDLTYSQVSDLTPLASLRNLELLDLRNTQVSDEEVERLQKALADCRILR